MLKSARWYRERGDEVSARLTLTRLITRHPRTAAAQQAVALIQQIDGALDSAPLVGGEGAK
jgi:outer membrane protein assembly factor BamD (BamD/ComL family)